MDMLQAWPDGRMAETAEMAVTVRTGPNCYKQRISPRNFAGAGKRADGSKK